MHSDPSSALYAFEYDLDDAVEWVLSSQVGAAFGSTPGQVATNLLALGHIDLADALLKRGVLPEPVSMYGQDKPVGLLHALIRNYNNGKSRAKGPWLRSTVQVLDYVLQNPKAWPLGLNELSQDGYPPFLEAARYRPPRYMEMMDRLVALGEDANFQGRTTNLLYTLLYTDHMEIGEQGGRASERQRMDRKARAEEKIQRALAWGARIEDNPHIALASAIRADAKYDGIDENGWGIRAQALVDAGLVVSSPVHAPVGVSPFAVAVEVGHIGAVKQLIAAGCHPAWIDPDTGDTLYTVAEARDYRARALVAIDPSHMSDIAHYRNAKGETPLHHAVGALSPLLVQHLLDAGADPLAPNARGKTPLEAVRRSSPKAQKALGEVVALIEKSHGGVAGDPDKILLRACRSGSDKVVCDMLAQGANPNARDTQGNSGLMIAIAHAKDHHSLDKKKIARLNAANDRVINALLDAGAEINAQNKQGDTALHLATRQCNARVVSVLLQCGADPLLTNAKGLGALYVWHDYNLNNPQYGSVRHLKDVVGVYLLNGVDIDQADAQGRRAFDRVVTQHPELMAAFRAQRLEATTAATATKLRSRRL